MKTARESFLCREAAALAVILVACPALYGATPDRKIVWSQVPRSTLPDKMAMALTNIHRQVAGKRCVVVFEGMRSPGRTGGGGRVPGGSLSEPAWNFKRFAADIFLQVLKECRIDFVDGRAGGEKLGEGDKKRRAEVMLRFAQANRIDTVLAVEIRQDAIRVAASSPAGEQLGVGISRLGRNDTSYFANTPPVNRRMAEFAEANLGKKVGRGECWDLCAGAMNDAGAPFAGGRDFGRKLDPDEVPFPGDPAATTEGTHYLMVHYAEQDGRLAMLHQNWMSGDERGRHVVPIQGDRASLVIWRPGPAPRDDIFKTARAIWEEAKTRAAKTGGTEKKTDGR